MNHVALAKMLMDMSDKRYTLNSSCLLCIYSWLHDQLGETMSRQMIHILLINW